MTVQTTYISNSFIGNGSTKSFPFTFDVVGTDASEIQVYVATVLQVNGYSIAFDSSGVGGTVTFLTAPANNAEGVIRRLLSLTQPTALPTEADLPEETLEAMQDRTVLMIQQVDDKANRSIQRAPTDTSTASLVLPTPEAGKAIGWSQDLASLVNLDNNIGPPGPTGATGAQGPAGAGNSKFRPSGITASDRALPTSGALSGTYIHNGAWTSTGALTFAHGTRIYAIGAFTLNHTLTATVQSNGGLAGGKGVAGQRGGGPGGGAGGLYSAGGGCGGGGYSTGGTGGKGATNQGQSGGIGATTLGVGGSGGGSGAGNGTYVGAVGGGGGPFLLIEVQGAVTLNETIDASGAAGTNASATTGGAGGGGGGGQVLIRCTGNFILAAAKNIKVLGGNGGNTSTTRIKGGGGGGGYVEIMAGGTITLTGTILATGDTKGTGATPSTDAANGTDGTSNTYPAMPPVSF